MKTRRSFGCPLALSLLLVSTMICPAFAGVIKLYPGEDTRLEQATPGTNYGADYYVGAGYLNGNQLERRSLIEFRNTDLAQIPSSFVGATLNLYMYFKTASTVPLTVEVHRITADWNEMEATWQNRIDNQFSTFPWSSPGGDVDPTVVSQTVIPAGSNSMYYQWDVTSLVQLWKSNPSQNFGLLIKAATYASNSYKGFYSREIYGSDPTKMPYLSVLTLGDFPDVPEPSTVSLLGLGLPLALLVERRLAQRMRKGRTCVPRRGRVTPASAST
jgi:hypothetical protein